VTLQNDGVIMCGFEVNLIRPMLPFCCCCCCSAVVTVALSVIIRIGSQTTEGGRLLRQLDSFFEKLI